VDNGVVLSVEGLGLSYRGRPVLEGVWLEVSAGQSVAVSGPTGSGKSTLLACVAGLLRPSSGRVVVGGTDLGTLSHREMARLRRRRLGVVFQFGELLPTLTAVENVALPVLLDGMDWDGAAARARELLVGLGVQCGESEAWKLSGGERQRVGLARALISDPSLLVADEPTGSLDAQTRDDVSDLLFSRQRNTGRGLLIVTHDMSIAKRADPHYRLDVGRLVPAQTLLERPRA
jgi:predicted ABC-type transport system involved in lysophospholipase L1 biosynthesis ATPase subunit